MRIDVSAVRQEVIAICLFAPRQCSLRGARKRRTLPSYGNRKSKNQDPA
jgi:hypothetical protein